VDVELKPGEMSLHHLNLLHASNPNRSDRKRVGLVIRYATPALERSAVPVIPARGHAGQLPTLNGPPSGSVDKAIAAQAAFRRMPLQPARTNLEPSSGKE
jgi:hypothetical protein